MKTKTPGFHIILSRNPNNKLKAASIQILPADPE